ncbi:MAG TPA: tRNA 2-thiocytidine biosynthesis protein TtcA [Candidatus Avacidaminococcus intestinavium]|uniref:tRNA 2-thiocytidine biosynthesis protein TtcA n=1 Tax=Candidatus Avacidaminococcus intestinavium TaxID=2840684 RepID=A0A9D1SKK5_9FIRM|nr:tRNA 2-thiocytidine biosynthesis protein TtcA [Candidatus Avacidaminococcus intestinavium]
MNTKTYVPAKNLSKLWRTIIEFDMLKPHDKILIGLSGGKDSMFLTAALAEIKKYSPIPFELACYTVDGMFSPAFPAEELQAFCSTYNVTHYHEQINVMQLWQNHKQTNTPCFTCAYFRRAATNRKALELGYNKIALAHHQDDAVETFLMNILTSGQLRTFLPVTTLSRSGLNVLRPLIYYREAEIITFGQSLGLKPLKNPCPFDGNTKREEIKQLIAALSFSNADVFEHLAAAMRTSSKQELWPEQLPLKTLNSKFYKFWQNKKQPSI